QALEKKEGDTNKPRMQLLAIDRLRQFSRILEPHEKIDAYRSWHGKYADEISQQLASLSDLNDRAELLNRLSILLQNPQK
ncbi:hypothetical protein ACMWQW_30820, partial [Escherichia coli]